MPLGLWKGKVEIYREENDRRHAEWQVERAEWRERHEELMARIDANLREVMAALKANTEAILRLIDRFDQWEGRTPGPPDLRSV